MPVDGGQKIPSLNSMLSDDDCQAACTVSNATKYIFCKIDSYKGPLNALYARQVWQRQVTRMPHAPPQEALQRQVALQREIDSLSLHPDRTDQLLLSGGATQL